MDPSMLLCLSKAHHEPGDLRKKTCGFHAMKFASKSAKVSKRVESYEFRDMSSLTRHKDAWINWHGL